MASNQREIQRIDKKEEKRRKQKKITWIVLAVIVVILAVMKICEININSVKERFTDENGNFSVSKTVDTGNFPLMLDSSDKVKLVNVNNKIGTLTPTSFSIVNSTDATVEYTFDHGYSNPILSNAGVFTLIYDQGQKNYRLDTTGGNVYTEATKNSILCADLNKNGVVCVATTSKEKLCQILVYNKSLVTLFDTTISDGYVVDVSISNNGKKVAAAIVNSENANLVTSVLVFDINDNELKEKIQLPGGLLADIKFNGNNIVVVGDSYVGTIKNCKSYKVVLEQGKVNTRCYAYTPSGDLVVCYGSYSNSADNTISYVKGSGRIKSSFSFKGTVKDISASSSVVSILTSSQIVGIALNGEEKEKFKVDDSVKSICRIGANVYVNKQSTLDKSDFNDDV